MTWRYRAFGLNISLQEEGTRSEKIVALRGGSDLILSDDGRQRGLRVCKKNIMTGRPAVYGVGGLLGPRV